MSESWWWNVKRTDKVRASRVRKFEVAYLPFGALKYAVRGWFDGKDYFCFGFFATAEEAREYVDSLTEKPKKPERVDG